MTERKFEPGDGVCAEPYLQNPAREPATPHGLVDSWRSIKAQWKGQRKGEERRKDRCIWDRRAASADIMTNFLFGGPVSVGRIVSCPLPSRHPLHSTLPCGDGSDFVNVRDPTPNIQNLCWADVFRELYECAQRLNFVGRFGRQLRLLPSG